MKQKGEGRANFLSSLSGISIFCPWTWQLLGLGPSDSEMYTSGPSGSQALGSIYLKMEEESCNSLRSYANENLRCPFQISGSYLSEQWKYPHNY